ncbi:hypothetical protein AGR56_03195 [Clostridium sp. DMHC 10]|uniref:hypothetical protein n=1 Tax=Clostridium sp. DMHC 10 TaxID=747377 RepID=UPI00069E9175|nr:hypothetical protein [Clostridium sp. DMHC 10]KOF56006.1 hypothetical protein AGR56_03195 [Clostridium sp. DMHC 10]
MKILYGTKNPAKIKYMKKILEGLDIQLLSLNDINLDTQNIDESGNNPLDSLSVDINSRKILHRYYNGLNKI